jgi:hypothetical protein
MPCISPNKELMTKVEGTSVLIHLWASYITTNKMTMVTNLTSSLLACSSSVSAGTSLVAVLVVVEDFNFVAVAVAVAVAAAAAAAIVVVCDDTVLEADTLALCVTSSLNKPLT